jgi:transposase InsO family protein
LQPTLVGEPFERVAIDISGPFRPSRHGYKYILAIIDYFSKYPVLVPLKRIDTETIAQKILRHWIAIFGAPQVIHSDRGSNFESELFRKQCEIMGIQKTKTSPYYPQADGLVERLFRTIKPLISATVKSHGISWCEAIPIVEMGLRASQQATIGFSPYEVIFGRRMRLPLLWQLPHKSESLSKKHNMQYIHELQDRLEIVRESVARHMRTAIQRQAEHYNRHKTNTVIQVGDQVLIKREGHIPNVFPKYKFCGPYQVVQRNNYWSYKLKDLRTGNVLDRNYNQLRRLKGEHQQIAQRKSRETSVESYPQLLNEYGVHHQTKQGITETPQQSSQNIVQVHQHPQQNEQTRSSLPGARLSQQSVPMPTTAIQPQPSLHSNPKRYPQRCHEPPRRLF